MKSLFDLSGKTVVITGGAGYLGTAMSDSLAQYGADLFVLGQDEEKCKKFANQLSSKYDLKCCEGIRCRIDSRDEIKKVLDYINRRTGHIDVLVNNAAFYGDVSPFEDCTDDDWYKSIEGTINSTFKITQETIKYMLHQKSGNIINISSMYGVVSPDMSIYGDSRENNPAHYGAGKAAIIQFTRYLGCVYGESGIRANCISPGAFPHEDVKQNKEFINNLERKIPLRRIGNPDDLKGMVVYLASDASSYVNGQNIMVDGGWTAW